MGAALKAEVVLPEHAGVANAIGAVVGRIAMRRQGVVTQPAEGRFRVHLAEGPRDFAAEAEALAALESALSAEVRGLAEAAGAEDISVTTRRDVKTAEAEGRTVFIEALVTAEASGRPRIAG